MFKVNFKLVVDISWKLNKEQTSENSIAVNDLN